MIDNQTTPLTENQRLEQEILDKLATLGNLRVQDDALIFRGTQFVLPEAMRGRVDDAIEYLQEWQESQEQTYSYSRTYPYRPYDGAAAFDRAMKSTFGTSGIGARSGFFGMRPPQYLTIDVAHNKTMQVPWGRVDFKPIKASFNLSGDMDYELGMVFELAVTAPKKYRAHIEAFFQVVEKELQTNSIYKGKAITAAETPKFLNTSTVDPSKVVYSDDAMQQLDANVWSALNHTDVLREVGLPLKRQVLLYGPYGTGKTLAGMLTAQKAEANGWTYIQVRVGHDDLYNALKTAQLYAPAVVMYEDVDQVGVDTSKGVAQLLDALDGIGNKGVDVMALFTTNHPDKLHKGMMRPGRLDAVIELAGLDAAGTRRLVEAAVPEVLRSPTMDWDEVGRAFEGLLPAFAKEAVDRAQRYAIARSGGVPKVIDTGDLVGAANGIRKQIAMMEDAPELAAKDPLGQAMARTVEATVAATLKGHHVDHYGDALPLVPTPANGRN